MGWRLTRQINSLSGVPAIAVGVRRV